MTPPLLNRPQGLTLQISPQVSWKDGRVSDFPVSGPVCESPLPVIPYPRPKEEFQECLEPPLELKVLAYNLYLRPSILFRDMQGLRAKLIPSAIGNEHDVVVFSEAFDNEAREQLTQKMRSQGYNYYTAVLGSSGSDCKGPRFNINGGVIIFSKWNFDPSFPSTCRLYESECGADALVSKGYYKVAIRKEGTRIHIIGTHLQANHEAISEAIRIKQLRQIREFADQAGIPPEEPLIFAGDFNVDKINKPEEYQRMLDLLGAAQPNGDFSPTYVPGKNCFAESGSQRYLDYILLSKNHRQSTASRTETREYQTDRANLCPHIVSNLLTSSSCIACGFPKRLPLSDHFAVSARLVFGF